MWYLFIDEKCMMKSRSLNYLINIAKKFFVKHSTCITYLKNEIIIKGDGKTISRNSKIILKKLLTNK